MIWFICINNLILIVFYCNFIFNVIIYYFCIDENKIKKNLLLDDYL